ncbi:molecular chaperone HtpG [Buchnera aphidicola (Mollitrichosiphum nigrofasciatum)]|uniref:molecular chaperone HtpG n=1 Tax=Buchnera aphidicola TaxID=9 RepID=UPI0031B89EC0
MKKEHTFQSEIKQLLNLMIHSLYSNKEIFIRELISNASDAIDKLKFKSLTQPKKYSEPKEIHIRIKINKEKKTLSIYDTGIGMSYKDTKKNLGTIAQSGTKKFLSSIKETEKKNNNLIGQFGVGFYSSFIVSKKVKVITKKANKKKNKATQWESDGKGTYHISKIKKKILGTKITLTIKPEEEKFLDIWTVRNIINKYSDHITVPIEIYNYDEKKKTFSWEKVNKAQALWTLNKNTITKENYQEFYKYISQDTSNPLIWFHNKVEGIPEYISLLYIPKKNKNNIWNKNNKSGLKLYIKRIYIMDDNKQFLPNYLRFVKGLIDSQDLPLNVSREILQNNTITKKIKIAITKKILNMLQKIAKSKPKKYNKFWKEFGLIFKEGPAEDITNKNIIYKLLRFTSINNKSEQQTLSLKEYIRNMQKKQKKIFFITTDNYNAGKNNPKLEIFKENNIDVLILYDRIDEWMMNYLIEFKGYMFQSVSKIDDSITELFENKTDEIEKITEEDKNLINTIKQILGNRVKDVRITNRLKQTPAVVISDKQDMSTQMSKLFIAAGQKILPLKYIFEINIKHNIIKYIQKIKNKKQITDWIELLFDQALLSERGNLDDPNKFIKNMNNILINNYIEQ